MLLVYLLFVFTGLALGLLALLEHYDSPMQQKARAGKQAVREVKQEFYNAFPGRQAVAAKDESTQSAA